MLISPCILPADKRGPKMRGLGALQTRGPANMPPLVPRALVPACTQPVVSPGGRCEGDAGRAAPPRRGGSAGRSLAGYLAGNVALVQALAGGELPHDHRERVHVRGAAHLAVLQQLGCTTACRRPGTVSRRMPLRMPGCRPASHQHLHGGWAAHARMSKRGHLACRPACRMFWCSRAWHASPELGSAQNPPAARAAGACT